MEGITDINYTHEKRFCKTFEIKNLEGFNDLYVQNDRLLLSDVFKNFRKYVSGNIWNWSCTFYYFIGLGW